MNQQTLTRRRLLHLGGVAGMLGLSGCTRFVGGDETEIRDTDGDGVVDRTDYAPRDPDVQRAEQVQQAESESTPEPGEPTSETSDGTATTGTGTEPVDRTVIDDFESGSLDTVWRQFDHHAVLAGREAFEVQADETSDGQYALRGINDGFSEYSGVERDDFSIDRDGSTVRLAVKLGPVQNGSQRANKIYFMGRDAALIVIDQKDRPGETSGARIGNGNSPDSVMGSLTTVEFRDIQFSSNRISEVVVGGVTVATNVPFLNEGSEILSIRVFQGHYAQPADIVVDEISFETPSQ